MERGVCVFVSYSWINSLNLLEINGKKRKNLGIFLLLLLLYQKQKKLWSIA
jgi:hypothetical protein